ncbi:MAG: 30S ribosomal protein S19e [Candidatus Verstraetearchaeota archaeon]|nr:30S ribosomal protein S19e [Candidatus Verstraetearchaeota archaeon]
MVSPRNIPADRLIRELASYLKENYPQIKPPVWALFVKTGVHKERPPQNPDWWYIRCASLLRKIFLHGPVGISRLRTAYGGRKRRGVKKEHFRKGSGAIIRKILQQLEQAGLVTKTEKDGRILTGDGLSLIYRLSNRIFRDLTRNMPELKKYVTVAK